MSFVLCPIPCVLCLYVTMEQQKMRSFGPVRSILVKKWEVISSLENGTDKMCSCWRRGSWKNESPDFLHDQRISLRIRSDGFRQFRSDGDDRRGAADLRLFDTSGQEDYDRLRILLIPKQIFFSFVSASRIRSVSKTWKTVGSQKFCKIAQMPNFFSLERKSTSAKIRRNWKFWQKKIRGLFILIRAKNWRKKFEPKIRRM